MTRDEARAVLGVSRGAAPDEVRRAYRRLVRAHHPDVAGPGGTDRAARVIEAYRLLQTATPTPTVPPDPPPTVRFDDRDAIPLAAPTLAVFERLCEAADVVGHVTHVEPGAGLLETIVHWDGWPACSLLITVQQRGPDTLAACTLESLEGRPGPPIERVVRELRRVLAALDE